MKWNQTLSVAAIAALALGAGACDDGLAEINQNPNAPTDVPAQYLLPEATANTVELFYGGGFNLEFAGIFTQHWAKIQYLEEDLYELRPATVDGWWRNLYAASLTDWQTIIEKGQSSDIFANHEATGRTMKAFTGHIMTDIWGDIPWSEALQGAADEPIVTPAYDAQSAIYPALVNELSTALTLFDTDADAEGWGAEDLLFGGDIAAWMQFANSLKLRLAVRASDAAATQATAWINEVLASPAGLVDDNAENVTLAFLESSPNQNPLYENWFGGRDDHAASSTLVDMMLALNDPRLPVYAEPAASDGAFRGMTNGTFEEDLPPINTISRIGHHWRGPGTQGASTPAFLMTAAEVHFLLAEVVEEGLATTGMTAAQHYNAGVTASLEMWNGADGVTIDAADIAAYLAQPGVAYGTGDSNLEQIAEQKWLALYTNGPEAYAELRRTGFPDEAEAREAHAIDNIPGRVPYPDVEQSLNAANWQAANTAQGIDGTYTGRVWWDMTPQIR